VAEIAQSVNFGRFSKIWGEPLDKIENCVLACTVCNNAKSDRFAYEEFKRVGVVIKEMWRQRKAKLSRDNIYNIMAFCVPDYRIIVCLV